MKTTTSLQSHHNNASSAFSSSATLFILHRLVASHRGGLLHLMLPSNSADLVHSSWHHDDPNNIESALLIWKGDGLGSKRTCGVDRLSFENITKTPPEKYVLLKILTTMMQCESDEQRMLDPYRTTAIPCDHRNRSRRRKRILLFYGRLAWICLLFYLEQWWDRFKVWRASSMHQAPLVVHYYSTLSLVLICLLVYYIEYYRRSGRDHRNSANKCQW
jgi:hypothetical protein